MCETVSLEGWEQLFGENHQIPPGGVFGLEYEWTLTRLNSGSGEKWECWHPETGEWEPMLPPPEGIGYKMTPGSKVRRLVPEQPAAEPTTEEVVRA